jgi:hypothetical protein
VIVPNSQAGSYFTLARSEFSVPSPQAVIVRAEVIPFGITSVSPNRIGDNGQVTLTLRGAKFENGATVQLFGSGTTLNAATVIRLDSSTVKARFMFANAPHGLYDVVLTNPSGQTSTQSGAVTIEQAVSAQPIITSTGNLRTRPLRPLGFYNEVINRGNVDIQYVSISTQVYRPNSTAHVVIINNRPNESLPRKAAFPEVDWNNAPPTNASSGNLTIDNFLYRDLAPGEVFSYNTEIRGLNVDDSFVRNQAVGLSRDELIGALRESVEFLRQQLIEKGINSPNLETAGAFWDLMSGLYQAFEVFEGVVEDTPSILRDGIKSIFNNLRKSFGPQALAAGCKLLVDNTDLGCGLKCGAKFACANIVTATSALAAVAQMELNPISAAFSAGGAGVNAVRSIKEGFNCANNCSQTPPPDCQFAGNSSSEEFAKPCVDFSVDPNEKLSLDGYGEPRFVSVQQEIPYTINFENLPTATAYAQRVRITDHLDPNLDPRTLRLREIGFKQYRFQVPDNRAFFQQRVQLGPDLGNLLADISAGVDISTGTVTWTLTAIDPDTGEQPNGVNLGLLPPNNTDNDGQGFVTFTVKPKSTAATGDVIHNAATITFDTEAPILTNNVSNTVDAAAPSSAVNSLPATQPSPTFTISWSGLDDPNGSGLLSYDIFFSANDGPYQPLLSGTSATSVQYTADLNTTYRFYSIARDNAGNVEAAPNSPDTVTTFATRIDSVVPAAGSASGGQQIRLTGAFANISTVTIGGASASWFYTNGSNDHSAITITTPPHAVGAVSIDLSPISGSVYSTVNAFAYLPTVFTDDTLSVGITTARAQHIIELRQAVDALRAVAGLSPAPWTDATLTPLTTILRAVHILELRSYLDDVSTLLGYANAPYTDPSLGPGFTVKRVHIEELRQRIRAIAGG